MATSYKTPGVYLEEIVKLPPSVASVETAIPCFFGVTEKSPFTNTEAKKIGSMADYELHFGGPKAASATVQINLNLPASAEIAAYNDTLYYAVKHYFDNGGGPCYICSVDTYKETVATSKYNDALQVLDILDEVSLVLAPDLLREADLAKYYSFYNAALLKATLLKDKFVVIDVRSGNSAAESRDNFRQHISNTPDAIKYGAAYYPNLVTTYSYDFEKAEITMSFHNDVVSSNQSAELLNGAGYKMAKDTFRLSALSDYLNDDYFKKIKKGTANQKFADLERAVNKVEDIFDDAGKLSLKQNLGKIKTQLNALDSGADEFDYTEADTEKTDLIEAIRNKAVALYPTSGSYFTYAQGKGVDNSSYTNLYDTYFKLVSPFFNSLFEAKMKEAFLSKNVVLPPSAAVCGLYAFTDRTRGVWKAPANVSVNNVVSPQVFLSDTDQGDFNVDAENGKSINCIRNFVGRGTLVWGARTVAGNNNEWKYVNVRRFFNMVEESIENAIRQFVFEPNDANTWVRVKGMIDNYLTNLWRDGALQGIKPEHAFYTAVGLNQTMTSVDILEGRMIVEVGLAVVRPAEFIILRFSHKLAVS